MARRRMARGGKRGHQANRLGPAVSPQRFPGLGISPSAGLVAALGIGLLIGIALAYHLLQSEVGRRTPTAEAQTAPTVAGPKLAETPAPAVVAQPMMPPPPLDRSPFALPRMAERPDPTPMPGPNAAVAPPAEPAWRRYAVGVAVPGGRPLIAILIDDAGLNRRNTARLVALEGPLTLAYMTYAGDLEKQSAAARARGHELMLHVPMEPLDDGEDAGPNALETGLDAGELRRRLLWGLDRLDGYVGVNNHMGSRFTAWEPGMAMVMEELKRRGLLFVDSRTIGDSLGASMAERYAVPHADRDVFLDNDEDGAAVAERLTELEAVAHRRGMAIGIGHPHDGTLAALAEWLPTLAEKGFVLVPVSTIVERRMEHEAHSAAAAAAVPPS